MSDILDPVREADGTIPNSSLDQAIDIVEAAIAGLITQVDPPQPIELLAVLEQHVASSNRYLAALVMDLANEMTEMWNFLGKMAGNKAHKPKHMEKDLDETMQALKFSRLMGMYNLLRSKGATDSGLIVP